MFRQHCFSRFPRNFTEFVGLQKCIVFCWIFPQILPTFCKCRLPFSENWLSKPLIRLKSAYQSKVHQFIILDYGLDVDAIVGSPSRLWRSMSCTASVSARTRRFRPNRIWSISRTSRSWTLRRKSRTQSGHYDPGGREERMIWKFPC